MVIIDFDGQHSLIEVSSSCVPEGAQHDPDDILKLLRPLSRGVDVVVGSRFCNGNGRNIPAYRKVGMKVLDIATNAAGGINVTDTQSGLRAAGDRLHKHRKSRK